MLVENRPGASWPDRHRAVANAAADGHTLVMASTAAITEKNIARLAPVALVSAEAYVIAVNAAVPIGNVRELIAFAKAKPGQASLSARSGIGAASHLSGELFKAQAQVDLQHVPSKGTGQALYRPARRPDRGDVRADADRDPAAAVGAPEGDRRHRHAAARRRCRACRRSTRRAFPAIRRRAGSACSR